MPGQWDPSMSVQQLKFTREQWLHYLNQLTGEKICASCWAGQLKQYLDRFWWTAKLCFTNCYRVSLPHMDLKRIQRV